MLKNNIITVIFAAFIVFSKCNVYATWKEEIIQDYNVFNINYNSTVVVNGIPHVFYKGRYLYHSYLKDNVWIKEKIDSGLDHKSTSSIGVIATVDSNNIIHLIYGSNNQHLKYAKGFENHWEINETPLVGGTSGIGDIIIDSKKNIHVIHKTNDFSHPDWRYQEFVEHAVFDGNTWSQTTIDYDIYCSYQRSCISATIDTNDIIHISYAGNDRLIYQNYLDNKWTKSIVSEAVSHVNHDIALNEINKPIICYSDYSVNYCATQLDGTWLAINTPIINSNFSTCNGLKSVLKKNTNDIMYAIRTCNNNFELLEFINDGWRAIQSYSLNTYQDQTHTLLLEIIENKPYVFAISSAIPTTNELSLLTVYPNNSGLTLDVVSEKQRETPLSIGTHPSALFDDNDVLHLTCLTPQHNYAKRLGNDWEISDLLFRYSYRKKLPIAIESNGNIGFYAGNVGGNNESIYLENNTITLTEDYLRVNYFSDSHPAVFVDKTDITHIAFFNLTDWSIYYGNYTNNIWTVKKIYTIPYTEQEKRIFYTQIQSNSLTYHTDINIDSNGSITIAFIEFHYSDKHDYKEYSHLVKLSTDNNAWKTTIISTIPSPIDNNMGATIWLSPSLKIDNNGKVHVSYTKNYCTPDACYPSGLGYGSDVTGDWKEKTLLSESYLYEKPYSYSALDWMATISSNLALNENDEAFISYIHGTEDDGPVNTVTHTSEIRTIKLNSCMPVSQIVRKNITIAPRSHLPINAYIDGAINNFGLGAVAFYDRPNNEPHVLTEEPVLNVKACITNNNNFNIRVNNYSNKDISIQNASIIPLADNIYHIINNNCTNAFLASNSYCTIDIEANLPNEINYSFNVESTLYFNIQSTYVGQITPDNVNQSSFVIETKELRDLNDNENNDTNGNPDNMNSGGSMNIFVIFGILIFIYWNRVKSKNIYSN